MGRKGKIILFCRGQLFSCVQRVVHTCAQINLVVHLSNRSKKYARVKYYLSKTNGMILKKETHQRLCAKFIKET